MSERLAGLRALASIALAILLSAAGLLGQATQGTIFGTITDSLGATVPRATVTVTSVERGITRSTTTNDAGEFTVTDLELGNYVVTVEATGFKKAVNPPVPITVKARIRVDTQLEVGQVSETVEVKATAPLLRTGSAETSNVIGRQELRDLPIIGRNILSVASLTAGTNSGNAGGRQAAISGVEITVSGAPAEANNFIIDGVSDNMEFSGTIATAPPIDAVNEFAVQTSQYSAEFGRSAGGVINIALKSGTNTVHGFAYDYLQNDVLNARPYDFTGTNPAALPLRRNQFGGGAGGPIKKNKFFWFGNYEGLRNPSGVLGQYIVPTAAQKTGDFSQSSFQVFDPSTVHADPNNPGQTIRNPFPGNIIPPGRFDPAGVGLLSYYPLPNYVSPTPGVLTNFLIRLPTNQTQNSFNVKGDAVLSSSDTVSGHFSQQRLLLAQQGWLPDQRLSSHTNENGNNAGISYTHILSPALLNEARISYNRFILPAVLDNTQNVVDQYNIPGWHTNPTGNGFPTVNITNLSSSAPIREIVTFGPPFALIENTYQYLDTMTWQKGKHSVKFGAEYDHVREDRVQARSGGGILTFNGSYTTQTVGQAVSAPRNGVADTLLGLANGLTTQYGFDAIRMKTYRFGAFVQDDWRLTPKLTVNLGLRYDIYPPYHEEQDRFANLDFATGIRQVPESARKVVQNTLGIPNGDLPAGWAYVPTNKVVAGTNFADFAPRLGLAYAPRSSLSFRGGFGIFYVPTSNNTFNNSGTEGNPFFFDFGLTGDVQTPISLRSGFPSGGILSVLASPSFSAYYGPLDRPDPYSEKYNADIQWSPRPNMVLDAGYLGQRSFHFPTLEYGNEAAVPASTPLVSRQPFPNIGSFFMYMPIANSNYNALALTFTVNGFHGLAMKSAFTFSKNLGYDTATDQIITNRYNLSYDYGPLDYDLTKRWNTSWVYSVPTPAAFHGFAEGALGGWDLSGILILQDGFPFTVSDSGAVINVGNVGGSGNRPNVVGTVSLPPDQRTRNRYFNTAAFQRPTPYTWGNAGKNILRGPGLANLNLGLQKRIPLPWEGHRFVIRFEGTNVANRVQLANPGSNLAASSFGIIQGIQSGPRMLQAALRYEF